METRPSVKDAAIFTAGAIALFPLASESLRRVGNKIDHLRERRKTPLPQIRVDLSECSGETPLTLDGPENLSIGEIPIPQQGRQTPQVIFGS